MLKSKRVFYISGLGDNYDWFRHFALFFWRFRGINIVYIPSKWKNTDTYAQKIQKIEHSIGSNFEDVVVIGESAGASLAINLFAKHAEINQLVTLCGVTSNQTPIAQSVLKKYPAFHEALQYLGKSQESYDSQMRKRITQVVSSRDPAVPSEKNVINQASEIKLPIPGHFVAISYFLLVSGPKIVRNLLG